MSPADGNLAEDLDAVLDSTRDVWSDLRDSRLLLTGGTGFFGCWLVESFLWANAHLSLGSSLTILTRDPGRFTQRVPHLAEDDAIELVQGDVLELPTIPGPWDAVIHAATAASATLNTESPVEMFSTIVHGTANVLELVASSGSVPFLLTSSGAVYGPQPPDVEHVSEHWNGAPDPLDIRSAYAEGKRSAELLGAMASTNGPAVKVARCFAFVGPYLPLDRHFAIGNFLRDGLEGRSIEVKGDGTTVRSYLYAADLVAWLWTILLRGETARPYNVGSEAAVTMAELAPMVADAFDPLPDVRVLGQPVPGRTVDRYVPSTARVRDELGVAERVDLTDAIARTVRWHRSGAAAGLH